MIPNVPLASLDPEPEAELTRLIQQFLKIAFLTGKPYELPANPATLQLAVTLSFLTYVIATWQIYSPGLAIGRALLDIALAGFVLYFALSMVGKSARFGQAFSGLCGANAVLNAVTLPVIYSRVNAADPEAQQANLIDFFFLVWSISVVAHIVRHSFDTNIPISIAASVGYIILVLYVMELFFSR